MKYCTIASADRSISHFTSNSKIMRWKTPSARWISVFFCFVSCFKNLFPSTQPLSPLYTTFLLVYKPISILMLSSPKYFCSTAARLNKEKTQKSQCNNRDLQILHTTFTKQLVLLRLPILNSVTSSKALGNLLRSQNVTKTPTILIAHITGSIYSSHNRKC